MRASQAGKHVFCEKPISLDRRATVEAIEAVRGHAGVAFQVGFHRRFDPDWAAAVDRMRAGELGEVYLFRTSLRDMTPPHPEFLARSGGFFVDVTIHDLDLARWMVGEVVEVSAYGTAVSDPRVRGDRRHRHRGRRAPVRERRARRDRQQPRRWLRLRVLDRGDGPEATVRIDHPQHRHYEWRTPGLGRARPGPRLRAALPGGVRRGARGVRPLRPGGLPPAVTASDALAAFDLAQAADRSWRRGRPVAVEPQRTPAGVIYKVGDGS